jgi:hypothetical protein
MEKATGYQYNKINQEYLINIFEQHNIPTEIPDLINSLPDIICKDHSSGYKSYLNLTEQINKYIIQHKLDIESDMIILCKSLFAYIRNNLPLKWRDFCSNNSRIDSKIYIKSERENDNMICIFYPLRPDLYTQIINSNQNVQGNDYNNSMFWGKSYGKSSGNNIYEEGKGINEEKGKGKGKYKGNVWNVERQEETHDYNPQYISEKGKGKYKGKNLWNTKGQEMHNYNPQYISEKGCYSGKGKQLWK